MFWNRAASSELMFRRRFFQSPLKPESPLKPRSLCGAFVCLSVPNDVGDQSASRSNGRERGSMLWPLRKLGQLGDAQRDALRLVAGQ
jgi:hypothetical protein